MQLGFIMNQTRNVLRNGGGWLLLLLFTGCQRDEVQVYQVSKEREKAPAPQAGAAGIPSLKWGSLPEGWQPQPPANQMRAASFAIAGPNGKAAELSVIPLPGMGGSDLEFVNMWRKQIGLQEVAPARLAEYVQSIKVGGLDGKLFDMRGSEGAQSTDPNGVLVATMVRNGVTWFFKLAGDEALVLAQKKNLLEFLGGVSFEDPPAGMASAAPFANGGAGGGSGAPRSAAASKPTWTPPASWKEGAPGPMLLAKFRADGEGEAHADITISSFPGDVGGLLMNLNRWRGQVGLGPLDASALPKETTPIDLGESKATLLDVSGTDPKSGQPARLIGVVVPREGETWFYKLMGNPQVADREKEPFLKFVQSARYTHAP